VTRPAVAEPDSDEGATRPLAAEDGLAPGEVRKRAVTGAAIDVMRGFGVRLMGLVGMLVLARLLTPREMGTVAFGLTLITLANFAADGGIGTALIRRTEPPARADLRALLAFQLCLTTALALVVSLIVLPFGQLGQVTAIMLVALPLTAVRVPGAILLERDLDYRPLAALEIVQTICYYVWAIATVEQGWGVWGLASASVIRELVGSTYLLWRLPAGRLWPSPSWRRVRGLLSFGLQYQAVGLANVLRDQGINAAVAIVAGVSALGLWSVAYRILQPPMLLLTSLWRISFPGMSRLVAAGEDIGPTIERTLSTVTVVIGVILAPLVAVCWPLTSVLLGKQWADAAAVIPPASLHLMVAGPISVAFVGYLWAAGDASAVLRATLAGIPFIALVLFTLLPVIGVAAVGFAWLPSGVIESVILIRAARRRVSVAVARPLAPPALAAILAAALGWAAASPLGTTFAAIVVGAVVALAVYLGSLAAWHRRQLLDTVHLASRGMRGALATSQ